MKACPICEGSPCLCQPTLTAKELKWISLFFNNVKKNKECYSIVLSNEERNIFNAIVKKINKIIGE